MALRQGLLRNWLKDYCQFTHFQMAPMQGDASFRRYFRIHHKGTTYVAMDAPPPQENCVPYVAIAKALKSEGLHVPEIIASDLTEGFLLISDLGDQLYLKTLTTANAEQLYKQALNALAILRNCQRVDGWVIPSFSADFMRKELELCKEWFFQKHLGVVFTVENEAMLNQSFDFLAHSAAEQDQVFMHRDYHSANLMMLANGETGILDFQDAFIGPVTYDLVSLLRDCYIAWPHEQIQKLALHYRDIIGLYHVSPDLFLRWFDLMGLQRHLKALLTFSRKFHRDNNSAYLQHIPRTVNYISQISSRYPECKIIHELISQVPLCVE